MEKFNFTVDSALLGELGEKLVSTVHVALTELVKNASDADASEVKVSIVPEQGKASRVIVSDNGSGMTVDQVRKYWMKIGTSHRQNTPVSAKYGRLITGSKGIGRFACRRLGLKLRLTTTAIIARTNDQDKKTKKQASSPQYQTTVVEFDWKKFVPGTDVESIECTGTTTTVGTAKTGTVLEIWGGLNDEWRASGFEFLKRQLAGLASNSGAKREGFSNDPGFNVFLEAPEFSGQVIDLREEVIDATWGTLFAEVDPKGRVHCKLNAKGLRGTQKYVSKPKFKSISGAMLKVGILPVTKEEARKPSVLSKYVTNEIVSEWGGVQVRFNGFRMFPYGDSRDDWLKIDADRGRRLGKPEDEELFNFARRQDRVDASRVLLTMLSFRSYIGQVDVTSAISGLTPRIDRQGFVENEVFHDLRQFARFAIDWANIYRDYYIRLRDHEEAEKARKAVKQILNLEVPREQLVAKAASFLRSEIKRIVKRLPETQQKEAEKTLVQTIKAIETTSASDKKQLEHLRLVASASTLTLLFAHEIRTVIGTLGATAGRLDQLAHRLSGKDSKELSAVAGQVRETRDRFDNLVGMTGIVGAFRKNDKLEDLHLKTSIDRAIQCFTLVIGNYGIQISNDAVATNLVVGPMIEGELYTVLLNLLSNAVKSVIAADNVAPRICFEAHQHDDHVLLRVLDNGIGLDEEFFEEVFTPFIADPSGQLYDRLERRANPEDAHVFGTGSGLGLSIVRDIVSSRDGSIRFVNPPAEWSACVEVVLP